MVNTYGVPICIFPLRYQRLAPKEPRAFQYLPFHRTIIMCRTIIQYSLKQKKASHSLWPAHIFYTAQCGIRLRYLPVRNSFVVIILA